MNRFASAIKVDVVPERTATSNVGAPMLNKTLDNSTCRIPPRTNNSSPAKMQPYPVQNAKIELAAILP